LVNEGGSADGSGITGAQIHILTLFIAKISYLNGTGKWVGEIRVIFKIPKRFILQMFGYHIKPLGALAYIGSLGHGTKPQHIRCTVSHAAYGLMAAVMHPLLRLIQ
jgi:hypothetical protein